MSLNQRLVTLRVFMVFVAAMPAHGGDESREVRAMAVPEVEAVLSSQIGGRITSISVRPGDRFQKGKTLVQFDCKIITAQRDKARLDVEAADETHQANLRLKEFGSVSELEVALSSAKRKMAQADLLVAEAQAAMCVIEAPFAGRVVKLHVHPSETVLPNDKLMELIDDYSLEFHLLAPSRWLAWLRPGLEFTIALDETGRDYKAKVKTIGARVNPVNQMIDLTASVEGRHPELLAGMSGSARFPEPPGGGDPANANSIKH